MFEVCEFIWSHLGAFGTPRKSFFYQPIFGLGNAVWGSLRHQNLKNDTLKNEKILKTRSWNKNLEQLGVLSKFQVSKALA